MTTCPARSTSVNEFAGFTPTWRQGADAGVHREGVWEYHSGKAERRGIDLSELVTEVLKRDIEINEALK